jgi:hypothetical protein
MARLVFLPDCDVFSLVLLMLLVIVPRGLLASDHLSHVSRCSACDLLNGDRMPCVSPLKEVYPVSPVCFFTKSGLGKWIETGDVIAET